jgi:hypothetical protein
MQTPPQLRFSLRHRLAPVDARRVRARRRPWLRQLRLDADERRRLAHCLFGADVVVDELFAGNADFFRQRYPGLTDAPVEWWDVRKGEQPRYELFLFGDGGVLFAAGQARALGVVSKRAWQGDVVLAAHLGHAQPQAIARWPDTLIACVDFGWFA